MTPLRRVEVALALLLAAASFAPWWTQGGEQASAWSGPHVLWLPVLLCLATVAARPLLHPGVALAGVALAMVITGWGRFASGPAGPADGSHQLAWTLQEQGAAPATSSYGTAWGYQAALGLMVLLLVTSGVAVLQRRRRQ